MKKDVGLPTAEQTNTETRRTDLYIDTNVQLRSVCGVKIFTCFVFTTHHVGSADTHLYQILRPFFELPCFCSFV